MTSLERVIQTYEAASDLEITHAEAMEITAGMFSDLTSAMMFGFVLWIMGMVGMKVSKGFSVGHHSGSSEHPSSYLKITKVYFPMVTVIKVDDGIEPHYYTTTEPGVIYPAPEVIETEAQWQEVLAEAKEKGARVEVEEF